MYKSSIDPTESFRTVDFVKLPDWEYADLYKKQFAAFEDRLHKRIGEQYIAKTLQVTFFIFVC